jgi:hypothetical protein
VITVDWTGGWSILLYVAAAIVTMGGALAIVWRIWGGALSWLRPAQPLVSFGHPQETGTPWIFSVGGPEADWARQDMEYERARLSHLAVDYLIESKGTTNADAVRELTTGVRDPNGREHAFDEVHVQILGPGERVEVQAEPVPGHMHEGMDDPDRAANFTFWARFRDARRRRWEATYEPAMRELRYRRLRGD